MTEINTFSALVDDVIRRSGRPDKKADIISYGRQAMRECQVGNQVYYSRDFVEDQLITTATPFLWTVPQEFRFLQTARYNVIDEQGNFIYPRLQMPGRNQRNEQYFYYRGVDYFVFAGLATGVKIDIGYFSYFKKLPYYDVANRPATFSLETNSWSYLTAVTDADKLIARNQVTNWMLFDWYDLILEGTIAKVFKTCSDPRAPSSFALFKSLQKDLVAGESIISLDA